jgi:lysophospholipase L1-like esterase
MSLTVKLALSPLLAWQAVRTRRRVPKLPEPEGRRQGTVGEGRTLRLLVAGDSSAAGVGVDLQTQALAAPLARRLAQQLACQVEWQLLAKSGLNTAQTLALMRQACVRADVAVVVTGVNDVVEQVSSQRATRAREALVTWLRHHGGVQHVVFLPLPPVHRFHGLPQPLRWVAGTDARRHNRALSDWIASADEGVSLVNLKLPVNRGMMARDGFHPGEKAYRYITQAVTAHLADLEVLKPWAGNGARAVPKTSDAGARSSRRASSALGRLDRSHPA